MSGFVYCIGEKPGGPVKIGRSNNPQRRLHNMRIGHPGDLQLLGIISGGVEAEGQFHRRFSGLRIRGEWFEDKDGVISSEFPALPPKTLKPKAFPVFLPTVHHHALLAEIDAFLSETGMGPSYFGKVAAGNSELVSRLRNGRRIWPETEDRVLSFIRDNRHRRSAA